MKIYKYQFHSAWECFHAPASFKPISVAFQRGVPTLWAEVDPDDAVCAHYCDMVPTGGDVPANAKYIGSAMTGDHNLVSRT